MVVVDETEDLTQVRRRIFPDVKKAAQKSAEATQKAMQATKESARSSATAVAKAVNFKKREDEVDETSPLVGTEGGNNSEVISLVSSSLDSTNMVDAPPIGDNSVASTSPERTNHHLNFLTADATIIMIVCFSVALAVSFRNLSTILDNQVPLFVAGSWVLLAYAIGQVFSFPTLKTSHRVLPPRATLTISESSKDSRISSEVIGEHRDIDLRVKEQETKSVGFFSVFFGRRKRDQYKGLVGSVSKARPSWAKPWSTLQSNREKVNSWEKTYDPTKDPKERSDLMRRLLRNKHFRRAAREPPPTSDISPDTDVSLIQVSTDLGAFDISKATADTLDDFVIEPILKLRGMDVFLTEQLESQVASHPWLISQGLRDVPTLVVNTLTQWGHILVYFEMPEWVQDWNSIVEDESDPDDVKALKRFLNGDSDYKNERLKVIPSLAEGPLAVKVLAPPKKETLLNCSLLPVSWQQYDPETTSKGRKMCCAIEVTLDCVSARPMRAMAGIVKRNLQYLSVDMATVIGKPAGQSDNEDELEACLGLWRMDHIDISACPQFPDRLANEASKKGQDPDVLRATKLVHMTNSEFEELATQ
jgi:hypothetical protein